MCARQNAKSCQNEYIKVIDALAQRWTIMCLIMLTVNCQAICETCHQSDVCASVPSDTYSCALQAAANNISRRVLQPPTLPTQMDTVRTSARSVSRCKSPLCDCFLFSALQIRNSWLKEIQILTSIMEEKLHSYRPVTSISLSHGIRLKMWAALQH